MWQPTTTTKPTGSKCASTFLPTTKSCTCISCPNCTCTCLCTHPSFYYTFIFYFIGGVGEDDDPSKYAILV